MEQIKAIVFDIDGTIFCHAQQDFPTSTKETLKQLKEKGYYVIIATSRNKTECIHTPAFFEEFPFDAYIFDGGACAYQNDKLLYATHLDKNDVETMMKFAKDTGAELRYSNETINHFINETRQIVVDGYFHLYMWMPPIKAYEGEPITNALLYTELTREEVQAMLPNSHIVDHGMCYEVTAKGVSKASGIARVLEQYNLTMDNTICVGDGSNDQTMLEQAHIGLAMGNANDMLKSVADEVIGRVDEDGIYNYFKERGLIG